MWRWSYQGEGLPASGTFTTKDAPNVDGFFEITGITGEANGVEIAGLQRTDSRILARGAFGRRSRRGASCDVLNGSAALRTDAPRLTMQGFGYALASGTYANPFYGAHFAKPDYYAFFSDPANRRTSEPPVAFTATIVP